MLSSHNGSVLDPQDLITVINGAEIRHQKLLSLPDEAEQGLT